MYLTIINFMSKIIDAPTYLQILICLSSEACYWHNIIMVQALCRDFHLNKGVPRYAIKLEIHKILDSVKLDFLFTALEAMEFPRLFIKWLHACVTMFRLSVKVNGNLEGLFKAKYGLRQEDPMSPYVYV